MCSLSNLGLRPAAQGGLGATLGRGAQRRPRPQVARHNPRLLGGTGRCRLRRRRRRPRLRRAALGRLEARPRAATEAAKVPQCVILALLQNGVTSPLNTKIIF